MLSMSDLYSSFNGCLRNVAFYWLACYVFRM